LAGRFHPAELGRSLAVLAVLLWERRPRLAEAGLSDAAAAAAAVVVTSLRFSFFSAFPFFTEGSGPSVAFGSLRGPADFGATNSALGSIFRLAGVHAGFTCSSCGPFFFLDFLRRVAGAEAGLGTRIIGMAGLGSAPMVTFLGSLSNTAIEKPLMLERALI